MVLLLFCSVQVMCAAVRGPYLQSASASRITVRWRTQSAGASEVRYGTVLGSLTERVTSRAPTKEHIVHLTGLKPDTTYFYSIGSPSGMEESGANYSFKTPPLANFGKPVRVWVLGDSGRSGAAEVRDGFMAFNGSAPLDAMVMLGDNAYETGTDGEYQAAVFDRFRAQLRTTPVWPTIGNHDTAQSRDPAKRIAYTDIFSLPTRGECGGTASGSERYYSFDCGDVHFVCLDSMTSPTAPNGRMAAWLRADLAATRQPWVVAFWHHAPYSKAGHDSDLDPPMREMRENIVPILEAGGVDLVLCGHSHAYERSKLIDGHYGAAASFEESSVLDSSPSIYRKPHGKLPRQGTAYVVAGTGSFVGEDLVPVQHPAMIKSFRRLGSLLLEVHEKRLQVRFVSKTGTVDDAFEIDKGPVITPEAIADSGEDAFGAGTYRTFGIPSINDAGDVAFLARLATPGGPVDAIVSGGIVANTGRGAFAKLSDPMLNGLGEVAFFGKESGESAEGIYSNRGGAIARIVKFGDAAPGAPGAAFRSFTAALFCDEWLAFTAKLRGTSADRDAGLWFSTSSGVTLALREGDTLSVFDTDKTVRSFDALPMGALARGHGYAADAREVFARVNFTDGTQAIIAFTPAGFTKIAASDELAPGDIFGARFGRFGVPCGAAFSSRLAGAFGSVTAATDDAAFVWDGALARIFTEGSRTVSPLAFTSLNAFAAVPGVGSAIVAMVKGEGVSPQNDTGIWWKKGVDAPRLMAREGGFAPGIAGRFKAFTSLASRRDAEGAPVFIASMHAEAGRVSASNDLGLWGVDSTGRMVLLMVEGQQRAGKTLRSFSTLGTVNRAHCQSRSMNASGQIGVRLIFTDHSQSIVVIQVP